MRSNALVALHQLHQKHIYNLLTCGAVVDCNLNCEQGLQQWNIRRLDPKLGARAINKTCEKTKKCMFEGMGLVAGFVKLTRTRQLIHIGKFMHFGCKEQL